jgi:hypothetical protein
VARPLSQVVSLFIANRIDNCPIYGRCRGTQETPKPPSGFSPGIEAALRDLGRVTGTLNMLLIEFALNKEEK